MQTHLPPLDIPIYNRLLLPARAGTGQAYLASVCRTIPFLKSCFTTTRHYPGRPTYNHFMLSSPSSRFTNTPVHLSTFIRKAVDLPFASPAPGEDLPINTITSRADLIPTILQPSNNNSTCQERLVTHLCNSP